MRGYTGPASALLFVVFATGIGVVDGQVAGPATDPSPELSLCSVLEHIHPGEQIPVLLSGVLISMPEDRIFFDPEQPRCKLDVQPSTTVDLSELGAGIDKLAHVLKKSNGALVTLRGEICGPAPVGPDEVSLPPVVAHAKRSGGRRYGHLQAFRTEFVVHEVLEAKPADRTLMARRVLRKPNYEKKLEILNGKLPRYPRWAKKVGVSGEVSIRVTVERGKVVSAKALSGDRLLYLDTIDYIKSWIFADDVTTTFLTTFVYRLEYKLTGSQDGPTIELELPWLVRVTDARNGW